MKWMSGGARQQCDRALGDCQREGREGPEEGPALQHEGRADVRPSEKDAGLAQKLGQRQPLYGGIPTKMQGSTGISWANLTPFSLQLFDGDRPVASWVYTGLGRIAVSEKRGTCSLRKSGAQRVSGGAKRQCDRTLSIGLHRAGGVAVLGLGAGADHC